ncbi:Terpene synthase metal binding domain protein [Neofusicoccum parvum]|uniref:Terpene synthase metal binding domain protein n=1 Tax=Neofusicoccum parvum TaxID=310453 RepID=A0ACB5SH48_9PEZI|nr:Terpene synthase metal binding domain protein [Neofusicoccum parvum]GME64264.1 Terpene synthase metal binding domain protein [Neofusicoccum parvum]
MAVGNDIIYGDERPKKFVRIPDMFASIMSLEPRVNPHYRKVKPEAEKWAQDILRLDEKEARRNSKADFTYMASVWIPDADEEALRVVVDWLHWVFYFDDQFDEGHLQENPEAAKVECEATLATMDDGHPTISVEEDPLRHIFQYTWYCFKKRTSTSLQERYKESMKGYCDALLSQVNVRSDATIPDVEEYMDFRRRSIAVYPSQELVEYAHGIELPRYVFEDKAMIELREISSDITLLQNDMLSYRKDLAQGVEHNIIHVYRKKGLSEQQAVDAVGSMFSNLYKRWYLTLSDMPAWGEEVDREVLKYICGCRDLAIGNIHWSFMTGRYLGKEGETVRKTRIMALP